MAVLSDSPELLAELTEELEKIERIYGGLPEVEGRRRERFVPSELGIGVVPEVPESEKEGAQDLLEVGAFEEAFAGACVDKVPGREKHRRLVGQQGQQLLWLVGGFAQDK